MPLKSVRVVMEYAGVRRCLWTNISAPSLRDLFLYGEDRGLLAARTACTPLLTSGAVAAGATLNDPVANWQQLMPNAGVHAGCNRTGFSISAGSGSLFGVRLGLL